MPANELHFSSDFKDIITYCKEHELFLGSGNLNADILNYRERKDSIIYTMIRVLYFYFFPNWKFIEKLYDNRQKNIKEKKGRFHGLQP